MSVDAVQVITRFAAGTPTAEDLRAICSALATWLKLDGAVPIERVLRLPTTPEKLRLAQRDQALIEAAKLVDERDAWACSSKLSSEWEIFISRGPWRFWRGDADAPKTASPLQTALFKATTCNRSTSLGPKQISRIIGHLFARI